MSTEPHFDHGTVTAYTNHKCRCDECRGAWAEYVKSYRKANKERLQGRVRARSRAYTRLAKKHPVDFSKYLNEELVKETPKPTTTQVGAFDPDATVEEDYGF
jgi:hypothetical protein